MPPESLPSTCAPQVAEVNPTPVKMGMELLGLCPSNLRLPLTTASAETTAKVKAALQGLGKI